MAEVICPKCKSENLRRSRTRGLKERLLKKLGWLAYRCREKNCRWRGLIHTEPLSVKIMTFVLNHKPTLIGLGIAVGIIVIFVPLLLLSLE